jgi:benzoyl-CoA 2,3-dioxygenase component A
MNAPAELFNQHLIDPEICIRCNTCEATCPVGAITHDSRNYVVIADKCNSCMACVPPCPTGSIDNWRMRPKAAAYTVEEQLLWDELPDAMSESDLAALDAAEGAVGVVSTEASSASVIGSGVQSDVFKSAAYGATVPPWSAAHPYTNLYGPKTPTTATVVGNVQVNEPGTSNETHHIVLDLGHMPFPVLEGQSTKVSRTLRASTPLPALAMASGRAITTCPSRSNGWWKTTMANPSKAWRPTICVT